MLKKTASFVPCLRRSGFAQAGRLERILNVALRLRLRCVRRLRPCWTAFLSILEHYSWATHQTIEALADTILFPQPSRDVNEEFNSRAAGNILGMTQYLGLLVETASALSHALGNSYRQGGKMIPGWAWQHRGRMTTLSSLTHRRCGI